MFVNATSIDGAGFGSDSGRFAIRAGSVSTLPNGWAHADVGAVGAPGSATFDGNVLLGDALTVSGSGADIWGSADEFHYAWKIIDSLEFEIEARVSSVDAAHAWAKAGLMIRADVLDPSSQHASIFVTPARGVVFQRRTADGGVSINTSGSAFTAPVWLRLVRRALVVTAYYKKSPTDQWTLLGQQPLPALPKRSAIAVGLAVASHADGTLARAKFEGV